MKHIRVSRTSKPKDVGGAIAGMLRTHGKAEVHAICAHAVNQAVMGAATALIYLLKEGLDLEAVPTFRLVTSEEEGSRTGICFKITLLQRADE